MRRVTSALPGALRGHLVDRAHQVTTTGSCPHPDREPARIALNVAVHLPAHPVVRGRERVVQRLAAHRSSGRPVLLQTVADPVDSAPSHHSDGRYGSRRRGSSRDLERAVVGGVDHVRPPAGRCVISNAIAAGSARVVLTSPFWSTGRRPNGDRRRQSHAPAFEHELTSPFVRILLPGGNLSFVDGINAKDDCSMKLLVVNVNTTASMTQTIAEAARSVAAPGTEIIAPDTRIRRGVGRGQLRELPGGDRGDGCRGQLRR